LRVSEICLGTMTFGEDWGWGSPKEECRAIYDRFRELGGNFIDTANLYTNGTSELLLGEFMEGHRGEVVLATKYTNALPGKDPNAAGNHRKSMMQAVARSPLASGLLSGKYRVTEQGVQSTDGKGRLDNNPDFQQFL
jgi:aryl-alcohol dehydrogenase-like predicted oxidoreductase